MSEDSVACVKNPKKIKSKKKRQSGFDQNRSLDISDSETKDPTYYPDSDDLEDSFSDSKESKERRIAKLKKREPEEIGFRATSSLVRSPAQRQLSAELVPLVAQSEEKIEKNLEQITVKVADVSIKEESTDQTGRKYTSDSDSDNSVKGEDSKNDSQSEEDSKKDFIAFPRSSNQKKN